MWSRSFCWGTQGFLSLFCEGLFGSSFVDFVVGCIVLCGAFFILQGVGCVFLSILQGVVYMFSWMGMSDFAGTHLAVGGCHVMGEFHQHS
jgi:hypothetical protein